MKVLSQPARPVITLRYDCEYEPVHVGDVCVCVVVSDCQKLEGKLQPAAN